jgi:ubiquinone/menaquinone biosynthesis C-methylase UbiE
MTNKNYLFGEQDSETKRLDLLNAVYNPWSKNFLADVLEKTGGKILEVGCGQGSMSQWLAEHDNVDSVLGLDIDKLALKTAAEKNIPKTEFELFSVYDLNQLHDQFDIIYQRFVLIHLTNPAAALKAIYNQLKPGGIFVCDTGIHSHCFSDPKTDSYDNFIKLVLQMFASQGKDADLGKTIASTASKIGFIKEHIQLQQPLLRRKTEKNLMYLSLKNAQPLFEQEGLATADELNSLNQCMLKDIENEDSIWAAPTLCQFVFRKI